MTRVFLGILVGETLREKLKEISYEIEGLGISVKTVEPGNFHISFSFLGEKSEEEIEKIKSKMNGIAQSAMGTTVEIKGIKLIPNEKLVRVVALDVRDSTDKLAKLVSAISAEINGNAKPVHLTLMRIKVIQNKQKFFEHMKKIKNISLGFFEIDRIQLIQSSLSREGPAYSVLYEALLV